MVKLVIEAGDCVKLKSGGHLMTVESLTDKNAICVWAGKGRIFRETLDTKTLKYTESLEFERDDLRMLVIEGLTHSTDEMREMGLKN